jgi:dTDP-4-dehydrorhamnose 3,5-epimerase
LKVTLPDRRGRLSETDFTTTMTRHSGINTAISAVPPVRPAVLPSDANLVPTRIPGVLIIEPKIFGDQRGFFFEAYQAARYAKYGISRPFVQDNISRSDRGTLRGLHLQYPTCQGKLVSVLRGRVLDVAVDVRIGSPTFGRHVAVELSDANRRQMWVPRGFAHGFLVLSESADFFYKCDEFYQPAEEIGLRWDDPAFQIKWGIERPTLSTRDAAAPILAEVPMQSLPIYGKY